MHQVYKIPLYRESDLNRLRWLGGLTIILGAILRSSKFPPEYSGSGLRASKLYIRLKKKYNINYDVITSSEKENLISYKSSLNYSDNVSILDDSIIMEQINKELKNINVNMLDYVIKINTIVEWYKGYPKDG